MGCRRKGRRSQFGILVGIFWAVVTFMFLAFLWPVIAGAIGVAAAGSTTGEERLLWGGLGAMIVFAVYLGFFHNSFELTGGPKYK
jgi:purine-cytosine permease-like protein